MSRSVRAVVLTLGCYATAHAGETLKSETDKPSAKPVAKVEVKAKADDYDPRRDDTASKTVIGQEEILKYGDTNVYDVLKRAPGVTVIGNSIRMRGLGNGYTQVLVNGERPPPGFSMDTLAPDLIERIEIIRAASAEYSMQAIAGTINIVLKKVVAKPQRDLRLSINHAREKRSAFVNGTLADRRGNLSWFLNATVTRKLAGATGVAIEQFTGPDGVVAQRRQGAGPGYHNSTDVNLAPRLNWKISDDNQLNLSSNLSGGRANNGDITLRTEDIGTFPQPDYIDERLWGEGTGHFGSVELNWVSKIWGGKLDAKVQGGKWAATNDFRYLSSTAGDTTQLLRLRHNHIHGQFVNNSGKYNRSLFDGHALATGWEVGHQRGGEDNHRIEGLVGTTASDWFEAFAPSVDRMAAFVQDEWNISKQWSMYLGARWEGIRTESAGTGLVSSESDNHVLSPVAQTLYKFPDKNGRQLRLALTRTFKAPDTNQLSAHRYSADLNTRFSPDSSGNPSLRPELATGIDLTYEHFWAPGALFSASTSLRRIHDTIRSTLGQDANGLWLIKPVNDGNAQVRTVDLELKFPLKAVMQGSAPPVDLRASLSRNWSRVDTVPGPDNCLDQQIPFSAVFGADYKRDKISMGINYGFLAGGLVRISQEQSARLQLRRNLDGYFQYTVRKGLDLRLSVGNALGVDTLGYRRYQDAKGTSETWTRDPSSLELRLNVGIKY